MKANNDLGDSVRRPSSRRRLGLFGSLAILALVVAACGSAAAPTPQPAAMDTAVAPTEIAAVPTEPAPLPTDTALPPTEVPPPTEAPAPTEALAPEASLPASVVVADQDISGGSVTVEQVLSAGPGWLVIHAQADGKPGPILGYSPVAEGVNDGVNVEIDLSGATETLYAMLHRDAGEPGTWEFPNGPDTPVEGADGIVTTPFALQVAEGEVEVAMRQFQFDPAVLVVKAGTTVTWVNEDGGIEHNVQSDTGLWESELYAGGESYGYTFEGPGIYPYHCHPHGDEGGVGMAGTIIVIP